MGKANKPPVNTSSSTATADTTQLGPVLDLDTTGGVDQQQLADIAGVPGAGNAMAHNMMSGSGTGSGVGQVPTQPPAGSSAVSSSAGGLGGTRQDELQDQDGEKTELSGDEVDQEIDKATTAAGPVQDGDGSAEGDAGGDEAAAADQEQQQGEGGDVQVAAPGAGPAVTMADSAALASFQMEKATNPLSKWDNEVAWNDAFSTPGQSSQNFEVDRGALIMDALSDGAVAGLKAGLVNTAMDTAVNLAATKIPYISGFVELAQIAYDPEAWLQAQSQATFGKFSTGFDQIMNGDGWDKAEGTVNLLSGAVGIIGLLTNICWIIAGVGFLASFICPALLPFVALCTSWATSLSAISGIAFLILSLLQLGLVGMRVTEIAVSDADPQDLLESGKSLEKNTQGFTTAYTARASSNMRQRAANKLSGRNPAATPDTPYNRKQEGVDAPIGKGWKALDLLSGNIGSEKGLGSSSKASYDGAKAARGNMAKSQDAFMGKGDYKRGGDDGPSNTTAQQMADMEHAGANSFTSTKARDEFYAKQADADGHGVTSRAQTDAYTAKAGYYADKDDAHADMAADRRRKATQAQRDLDDAQTALTKAQGDNEATIKARTDDVRAAAALKASYHEDVGAAKTRLTELETRRATAAKALGNDAGAQTHLAQLDAQIKTAKTQVSQAQDGLQQAAVMHSEGVDDLKVARQPVFDAKGNAMAAEENLTRQTRMAELSDRRSGYSKDEQLEMETLSQKAQGGKGVDAVLAEEQKAEGNDIFQSAAGNGPSAVHGMKKRHDRALIKQVHGNSTDEEEAGGPLGLWQSTMDDKDIDWVGDGGKLLQGSDDSDWYEQFLSSVGASLPAAPLYCPDQVDGASLAWDEIEQEEHQLVQQTAIMGALIGDGQADVQELQGVQDIAGANMCAVDEHQTALDERGAAQTAAVSQAQDAEGKMGEASGKAGENQSKSGGIVGKFMEMLNIVPASIIPGGKDAKDGMQQLGDASTAGVDATTTGAEGAKEAQTAVAGMQEATTATKGTDQIASTALTGIQSDAAVKQASAQSGVDDLASTEQQANDRLLTLAAEQERLEQVHDGGVLQAMGWTQVHETTRVKGLGEYADVLKLAD